MIADQFILALSNVSLQAKQLLPEYSGIYYVLDETNTVWYIGQAKNIRNRWQGKSHHRIYQLEAQKKRHFTIYYEQVNASQLDSVEKQRIEEYSPHLNNSPVKTKKIHPTETLLKETLVAIADFAFILGIDPPKTEIASQTNTDWLKQNKILGLSTIHICFNLAVFKRAFKPESIEEQEGLLKKIFSSRKAYANKWEGFASANSLMCRLLVNGYAVEIHYWSHWSSKEEYLDYLEYTQITLAQESISALTPDSLLKLQHLSKQNQVDFSEQSTLFLNRLAPYTADLLKLFFKESVDRESIKQLYAKISDDYKAGKRGVGSRPRTALKLNPINSELSEIKFNTIEELLIYQGIDPDKYSWGSSTSGEVLRKDGDRIGLYIECFTVDKNTTRQYMKCSNEKKLPIYNVAHGVLNNQPTSAASCQFNTIYLLAGVEPKAWLLMEKYLEGFARSAIRELSNGEGYIDKFYVSPQKSIVPAKVNIKLETIGYSAWIPFGASEEFPTLELATKEIRRRLKESCLPGLKFVFKHESITKLRLG